MLDSFFCIVEDPCHGRKLTGLRTDLMYVFGACDGVQVSILPYALDLMSYHHKVYHLCLPWRRNRHRWYFQNNFTNEVIILLKILPLWRVPPIRKSIFTLFNNFWQLSKFLHFPRRFFGSCSSSPWRTQTSFGCENSPRLSPRCVRCCKMFIKSTLKYYSLKIISSIKA